MKQINEFIFFTSRWARLFLIVMFFVSQNPVMVYSRPIQSLQEVNDALEEETENVIQTGRLIANIILVIAFVFLMLNIAFKVMDNSKATVIFLFILFLRGLYEVIF